MLKTTFVVFFVAFSMVICQEEDSVTGQGNSVEGLSGNVVNGDFNEVNAYDLSNPRLM